MMNSKNPEDRASRKSLYRIFGIVLICLLIGSLRIFFQTTRERLPISASTYSTFQINIPTGFYPTIPPSAPAFTVPIHGIGQSGITGTVTFKDIAGTVAILLHIEGPLDEESEENIMPVELRYGSCSALGVLAYPMVAPDAGESETDLSINLKEFNTQRPMAVVLYRSAQDLTAIACGDIP
jgi:hypothetical protein